MIYLDFNGKPTPGDDLVWFAVRDCGCATAVACVALGDEPIAITEEQARIKINETKAKAKRDKRRYELGLRSTCKERLVLCECAKKADDAKPEGGLF